MKAKYLMIIGCLTSMSSMAQPETKDSVETGSVTIQKDPRIETLGKKLMEYNESLANKIQMQPGYRLMLLSTADRTQAMQVRSQLLQQFPDQKVYMTFQSPYIKLKFGNFLEKTEAEKMRKQLAASNIIPGNIYLLPEQVEVKPDKTVTQEE